MNYPCECSQIAKQPTVSSWKNKKQCILQFWTWYHTSQTLLLKQVKQGQMFISFDEALNKVIQKCQMNIVWGCSVYFRDKFCLPKCTYYLTSVFRQTASKEDLLQKFQEGISSLLVVELQQVGHMQITFLGGELIGEITAKPDWKREDN